MSLSKLDDVLTQDYKLLYFNINFADQADTFLIAETQYPKDSVVLNGNTISLIAKYHFITIFVEGINSMNELALDKRRLKHLAALDRSLNDRRIEFYGWDSVHDDLIKLQIEVSSIEEKISVLENCLAENHINLNDLKGLKKSILSDLKKLSFLKASKKVGYISTYKEQIKTLMDRQYSVLKGLSELYTSLSNAYIELEEMIKKHFPDRRGSMILTLNKILSLRYSGEFSQKAIFTATSVFLEESEKNEYNREFNLNPLYQELEKHRAVILIPK